MDVANSRTKNRQKNFKNQEEIVNKGQFLEFIKRYKPKVKRKLKKEAKKYDYSEYSLDKIVAKQLNSEGL